MATALTGLFVVLALFFVALNGFFVAAEFALVKVRSTQLQERAASGDERAKHAQRVHARLNEYLNACQLGITLASLALGWIGEPAFAGLLEGPLSAVGVTGTALHTIAFGIAFATITVLHIVLGEIVPKTFSIQAAERAALWTARPLHWFYVVFKPAIWTLNELSFGILRLFGVKRGGHESEHTEEELRLLLAGSLTKQRADIVMNLFDLKNLYARNVMTPRPRIVPLDLRKPFDENLAFAEEAGYTRFPLVDGDIDQVVGMVHYRDLARLARSARTRDLGAVKREVLFVPESKPVENLLADLLRQGLHMAVVVDEFGATAGLVTLEDIFEELFGEIRDEFDTMKTERPWRKVGDGHFVIEAQMPLHEAENLLQVELPGTGVTTIGGYVVAEAGRVPSKGEHVRLGPYDGVVREADRKRVKLIEVWRENAYEEPRAGT